MRMEGRKGLESVYRSARALVRVRMRNTGKGKHTHVHAARSQPLPGRT